jgi:hypothetical protein
MGAALVAFLLLSGDLGAPTGIASASSSAEAPGRPGLIPGIVAAEASVASELRAGEAPLIPGAVPRAFIAEILIPRLALELRNPGVVFAAWYSPRIFWEDPNPSSASEPLIFHMFGLTLDARTSRNVRLTALATGAIGEPDYSILPLVFGAGTQSTLPPVVEMASEIGQARVTDKLSPRWGIGLGGQASHWQWLDLAPGAVGPNVVTRQTSLTAEPAVDYFLTARDTLGLRTAVGWVSYSTGAGAFTITPAATWERKLDRGADLSLRLGVAYAHLLGSVPQGTVPVLGTGERHAVAPVGSGEIVLHLARRDEILFLGRAIAGVDYYFDPVLGTGQPRGSAAAELTAVSVPNWTVNLRGDFATVLQSVPAPPGGVPPDATAFSLTLAVRRRVTENFYAELGGRWANRGPTLDTPDFRFDQRQLWAYLSLIGTTRPIPRPTLPKG